jgi:hypothetical protein
MIGERRARRVGANRRDRMSHATITCTLALAAALLAACDKKPTAPPKPQSSTTVAAANIPSGIVSDPSVPPASQVMNEASPGTGQETAPARPTGEPRKDERAYEAVVQKLGSEAR